MRALIFTIIFITSLTNSSFGQTILELFRALPLQYAPELTINGKDSVIRFGNYTIPGGDSLETMEVALTEPEPNFIQLDYWFTTGQAGFITIALRKFEKRNGDIVLVYAKYGGMRRAFDQHTLLTFDYTNGKLLLNKKLGLPETTSITSFLKSKLPDALKASELVLSTSYDLHSDQPNSIEYVMYPQTDQFDEWIRTDRIIYTWDGNKFRRKEN